jgi:uncharacterized membrane protein YoaK (UPF0700 family)
MLDSRRSVTLAYAPSGLAGYVDATGFRDRAAMALTANAACPI